MKPIKPKGIENSVKVNELKGIHLLGPLSRSKFKLQNELEVDSFCLLCPEKNCLGTSYRNEPIVELCPSSSISIDIGKNSAQISNTCFGCGLCLVACPVGAISIGADNMATVNSNLENIKIEKIDSSEWLTWLANKVEFGEFTESEIDSKAAEFAKACMNLKGNYFYKTIETLLRAIGYDAKMSNLGDTSNRIDLIIRSEKGNVPVEIKSYTETPTINWKSIQQAVENKLLNARLNGENDLSDLSSLVIGYQYPSERTGIEAHIKEIENAYGIGIGVTTLEKLWKILLSKYFSNGLDKTPDLTTLRGVL